MIIKIIIVLFIAIPMYGQYDHVPVFPDLDGEDLKNHLIEAYRPAKVLSLSQARDTLYRKVYLHNDSVKCVYSNLAKHLDLNEDPSQYLFGSGSALDFNLEHSYPRSKGAEHGNPSSDMHHLFPSRVDVNSARAANPFSEIEDSLTSNWYYKDETTQVIPNDRIELYSESKSDSFEPQEGFKGNIARAIFYFYTMYEDAANTADDNFFAEQVDNLCEWHFLDPVDSLEWARTFLIAYYQDNRPNPFVLDCNLVRLYCPQIDYACELVNTFEPDQLEFFIYPNLLAPGDFIKIESNYLTNQSFKIQFVNMSGQSFYPHVQRLNSWTLEVEAPKSKGSYILNIIDSERQISSRKLIVF